MLEVNMGIKSNIFYRESVWKVTGDAPLSRKKINGVEKNVDKAKIRR